MFEQSFNDYLGYDEKSKAQHNEPSRNNLKPDMVVKSAVVVTTIATKPWLSVLALVDLKKSLDTSRGTFFIALLINTIIFQDQYSYRRTNIVGASLHGHHITF